jgi:hypothetical protein
VIVNAGPGSIVNVGGPVTGTITGRTVQLAAQRGIGDALSRIKTSADTLSARNTGLAGGIFISEANDVLLATTSLLIGGVPTGVKQHSAEHRRRRRVRPHGGRHDHRGAPTASTAVSSTGATVLTTTGAGHNIDIGANNVGNSGSATTLTSAGNITGTAGEVRGTAVVLDSARGRHGCGQSPEDERSDARRQDHDQRRRVRVRGEWRFPGHDRHGG